jgi:hypothetical protein
MECGAAEKILNVAKTGESDSLKNTDQKLRCKKNDKAFSKFLGYGYLKQQGFLV